ncbi:acyl-CoA thioesterase [Gilvimarinus sp. F26214L]|uniref:acyl-CoA thioesterase n=1 Tax=Gilvimarinus sp. DZF01 TaxID=3461371 RepID=UPI0040465D22
MTPTSLLNQLLDVQDLGDNQFLGKPLAGETGRLFGGQVLGQALMAAAKTVDATKLVHSSHNYFVRPGDAELPVRYQVHLDLDGRSFSNRRVVALQNDKPILNLTASFQGVEPGLEHQLDAPSLPDPDELLPDELLADKHHSELSPKVLEVVKRERPVEVRSVDESAHFLVTPRKREQAIWFRVRDPLADSQRVHRAALAYASDSVLLSTCTRPHGLSWAQGKLMSASIDHALWIHDNNIQANDWMAYVMDTPWAGNARGMNRGSIFAKDGRLLASVAQEGLIRAL